VRSEASGVGPGLALRNAIFRGRSFPGWIYVPFAVEHAQLGSERWWRFYSWFYRIFGGSRRGVGRDIPVCQDRAAVCETLSNHMYCQH
jgi:hypothetical protein